MGGIINNFFFESGTLLANFKCCGRSRAAMIPLLVELAALRIAWGVAAASALDTAAGVKVNLMVMGSSLVRMSNSFGMV
jgi:hypothetical protein